MSPLLVPTRQRADVGELCRVEAENVVDVLMQTLLERDADAHRELLARRPLLGEVVEALDRVAPEGYVFRRQFGRFGFWKE